MMQVRFPFSLRDMEDLLHECAIDVIHETVRYCWNGPGRMFAFEIIQTDPRRRFQCDERTGKIHGQQNGQWGIGSV